jgi:hypothetical protein
MLKKILLVLILVIGAVLIFTQNKEENRVSAPNNQVANFSGTLQEVNTGCFADGECYVTVDRKHVTAIMGWSQEIGGTVQGVEGFGDLENYIGQEVEVYAADTGDGKYTLYGSEGFYIRLK